MTKARPPGGRPGGQDDGLEGTVSCPSQSTATLPKASSLDLNREQEVLHALARALVALLPQRSAISQRALDELAGAYDALGDVERIIGIALLRPAGPEVGL